MGNHKTRTFGYCISMYCIHKIYILKNINYFKLYFIILNALYL